jgi:membrane protease subunit HflC
MNRSLVFVLGAFFAAFLVATNTFYIVPLTQQALVLQLGQVQRVINRAGAAEQPGLYVKAPFVQNVVFFDKRNMGFTLEEQLIVGSDQERLVVDAFLRYRIVDPLRFYRQVQTETRGEQRLETILEGVMRRVLGAVRTDEISSARRGELMRLIATEMEKEASAPGGDRNRGMGVQIIDVRIRQADFVPQVQERVFERMRTERQQVAAEIRARGNEEAAKVRAEAERQRVVILAEATEQAERIRGEGDSRRGALYASSFGRDPEFAAFYQSMQTYEKSIQPGTQMIIPPDGEFFRYLRDKQGQRR